jgi:hypothetical protein
MVFHVNISDTVKFPFLMVLWIGLSSNVLVLGFLRGVLVVKFDRSVRKAHGNQSESDFKIRPLVGQWLAESTNQYFYCAKSTNRRRGGVHADSC